MREYTVKEFSNIVEKNGWRFSHKTGSHAVYRKPNAPSISIPVVKKCVSMPLTKRLIKEHKLEVDRK